MKFDRLIVQQLHHHGGKELSRVGHGQPTSCRRSSKQSSPRLTPASRVTSPRNLIFSSLPLVLTPLSPDVQIVVYPVASYHLLTRDVFVYYWRNTPHMCDDMSLKMLEENPAHMRLHFFSFWKNTPPHTHICGRKRSRCMTIETGKTKTCRAVAVDNTGDQ